MQRRTLHPNSLVMPHPLKRGGGGCPGTGVLSQELARQALIAVWEGRAALDAARPSQTAIKRWGAGASAALIDRV